ncbi:hypothetical protein EDD11_002415 [Mortierella claussenii]|nr:hypothetical protein EDD11_002415 [Mortierella claussenii]
MPKKGGQEKHPLHSAAIPNTFYFTSNNPEQHNAVRYFKTFADLHSSKKEVLHGYWRVALDILVQCSIRNYQSHGQRLKSEWNTPSKGLGDFWKHLNFDDDHAESNSKRQRRDTAMNDDDKQLQEIEDGETAAVSDGAMGIGVVAGMLQVMEGQDNVDEDSFTEADNFERALPEPAAATFTMMVGSSEPTEVSLQPAAAILKPMPAIYDLTGGGDQDFSREGWSPYVVNGVDVSDILWDYRSEILEKAERMEPLEPVERLAVNNIYLFEQEGPKCSLFDALGAKHWSTITKSTLRTRVTKEMLSEIGMKAVEISRITPEDARTHVDSTAGNKEIRRLLTSLFEDDFLWDKVDFNELELMQHLFNPFLKTFFGGMSNCKGQWGRGFKPSRDRRQMDDPTAKSRRPDFFMELILAGLTCYLIVLEAKKPCQTSPTQTDTEKVANLLRDNIDYLARAAVNVSKIKIFGVVVVGEKATVYTMQLVAKDVYVMKTYAVFYVPRSKDDLAVIGTAMDVLMNMKVELEALISQCEAPGLPSPSERTTTSYRTPQKAKRTGVRVSQPNSPSIMAAANRRSNI